MSLRNRLRKDHRVLMEYIPEVRIVVRWQEAVCRAIA